MNTLLMSVSVFLDNAEDNTVYIKGIESGGAAFLVLLLPPGHTTEETTSLCPPLLLFSMNLWFEEFERLIFFRWVQFGLK